MKTFRDLKHYTSDTFCIHILRETYYLNEFFNTDNVDQQVDILTSVMIRCVVLCPRGDQRIASPTAPWITDEIREAITLRNATRNTLKNDRLNTALQNTNKNLKRRVKNRIHETKVI